MPKAKGHAARIAGSVPGILLEADKIAHTFMRGVHGRRRVGQGEAFWQFRHYQAGDSSRDVDWRQTAKRNDAFVREREWEASQTLWLYRDATASMDFSSDPERPTKKEYAELVMLALAIVALRGGEQVALLGADIGPQAHEQAIHRLYSHLAEQVEMTEGARPVSLRSSITLISDFYQPVEKTAAFCAALAGRGVSGVLLQICDPAEVTLPYNGRVRFVDAEAEATSLLIPEVSSLRADYQEKFFAHRKALVSMAEGQGMHFVSATTDEKPEAVFLRLYDLLAARRHA